MPGAMVVNGANLGPKMLQSCLTLCDRMDCSPLGSSVHGDSPGKNTEVGFHALLQGIFPIQGLNGIAVNHLCVSMYVFLCLS